jgi:hypothetical protein
VSCDGESCMLSLRQRGEKRSKGLHLAWTAGMILIKVYPTVGEGSLHLDEEP